jgi:hypothetical protein
VTAALTHVTGRATVFLPPISFKATQSNQGGAIIERDVVELGRIVEERCPVAAMFVASGCEMDIEWKLGGIIGEDN